ISRADEAKARAEHVVFSDRKSGKTSSGIEYAVDFVLERLPPLVGAGHAEVIVETTLDAALQKRAGDIVSAALERQGKALSARQAAVIVIDTDGGIRALVGGRDYAASQFNRAVKARRQPGSAFKPFVYLAALESGVTPDTVTYDLPLSIDGWSPRNDSGQYVGEITVRKAIANSVNTVAVRLHQSIGRGRTADVARRLGIRSELRDGPSLALGTSEVSLMELTGAYGVLGNGGALIEPHAIRRVRMSSGRVLFAREAPRTTQIVDAQNVAEMNDLLNGAVMTGTGRRAALPGHPVAGKTGTTQEFRDALFVGYTAHLTAGVWIGNDDGRPMNRATGGGLPAEIWRDIMVSAHAGKAPLALPGTILRSRELPWAPVAASSPPRSHATDAERRRANEFLPWEKLNTGKPVSAVHPSERIGDDFIAKALAGVDGNEIAADGLADAGPSSASAETPRVERPRGMMSLGGWW
ncbi:MAG: transglycosylase domain-containing protein, partial [Hyphomicrobium sp.]